MGQAKAMPEEVSARVRIPDVRVTHRAQQFSLDNIAEVRLALNVGKAEYGRNSGEQLKLVTRLGSNTWNGYLFEYVRNS